MSSLINSSRQKLRYRITEKLLEEESIIRKFGELGWQIAILHLVNSVLDPIDPILDPIDSISNLIDSVLDPINSVLEPVDPVLNTINAKKELSIQFLTPSIRFCTRSMEL